MRIVQNCKVSTLVNTGWITCPVSLAWVFSVLLTSPVSPSLSLLGLEIKIDIEDISVVINTRIGGLCV